jgi:hypothetical protein
MWFYKVFFSKKTYSMFFICIVCLSQTACGSDLATSVSTLAILTTGPSSTPTLSMVTSSVVTPSPANVTPTALQTTVINTSTPENTNFSSTLSPTIKNSVITPQIASSQDWEYHWLADIPCKAPCWEGITPGKTKVEEAKKILLKLPFVIKISESSTATEWEWVGFEQSLARIRYSNSSTNSIVTGIDLPFPKTFRLKDIIQVYGNPSYAWTTIDIREDGTIFNYGTYILFKDYGLLLSNGVKSVPTLDGNTLFYGVSLLIPGNPEEIAKQTTIFNPSVAFTWQGYKDFKFYCISSSLCNKL